jgi:hypothetical protein
MDVVVQVLVGIAHVTAIEDQRMIQQAAVAVGGFLQLVQEVVQTRDMILIQLGVLRNGRRIFGMCESPWKAPRAPLSE